MDKKLLFTGGEPDVRLDHIYIDAEANRPALHAMLESFAVGANPNFIIQGCIVVVGGVAPTNTWSVAAGYIYLNDEIVQVDSDSGVFDSGTQVLAYDKVVSYNSDGDKTFIDGNPRQTWQENRGVITAQSSVSATELDAINGEQMDNKIKRYIAGGIESFTNQNATIANDTRFVNYTLNGPSVWTLTIPDADDENVYNNTLIINMIKQQGVLDIEQADTTTIISSIGTSGQIILVNDGSSWNVLLNETELKVKSLSNGESYSVTENIEFIKIPSGVTSGTITLPKSDGKGGKMIRVMSTGGSGVTIEENDGTDLIASSTAQYYYVFESDTSNWIRAYQASRPIACPFVYINGKYYDEILKNHILESAIDTLNITSELKDGVNLITITEEKEETTYLESLHVNDILIAKNLILHKGSSFSFEVEKTDLVEIIGEGYYIPE